jgi:hypothetical protein
MMSIRIMSTGFNRWMPDLGTVRCQLDMHP